MKKLEALKNHIAEQNKSDSGDPLVTSLIIIGVMVVVALAIYIAFGDVLTERADDVAGDIQDSGTQFDDGEHVKFDHDNQNSGN